MHHHLFEDDSFLTNAFNAIPFPIIAVDDNVRILFWNSAAYRLIGNEEIFQHKSGEVLHCIHSMETNEGCGHAPYCKTCVVRNSVNESFHGGKVYRQKTVMELKKGKNITEVPMLITASPFVYKHQSLTLLILENIHDLMQLGSLLPICANCKKIRLDTNKWLPVEKYIKTHIVDVEFTHGLCPDWVKDEYPEYVKDDL
jgi:PAS domain-containing protein